MPGIMDSITSVLQSPVVQELLPTALGAAGGFLTTPRRAGAGGAIGHAALGASQGLYQAQQAGYRQMLTKHYALMDQISQKNLDSMNALQKTYDALSPEDKKAYPTPDIYAQAMAHQSIDRMSAQSIHNVLAQQFNTPDGKKRLAAAGFTDPSQLPVDKAALDMISKQIAPPSAYEQASLDIDKERAKQEALHQGAELGIEQARLGQEAAYQGGELGIDRARLGQEAVTAQSEIAGRQAELAESQSWIDPKTRQITRVDYAKGQSPPAPDIPLKKYEQDLGVKPQWVTVPGVSGPIFVPPGQLPPAGSTPYKAPTPKTPEELALEASKVTKEGQANIAATRAEFDKEKGTIGKHTASTMDFYKFAISRNINPKTGQPLGKLEPGWKWADPLPDGTPTAFNSRGQRVPLLEN